MKEYSRNYGCSTRVAARRRKVQYRRLWERRGLALVLALFVFMIGISTFSIKANASSKSDQEYKYYMNYCVTSGDSLWNIAEEHVDYNHYKSVRSYVKEIQEINHISGDHILNGTYIIIPYFSSEEK